MGVSRSYKTGTPFNASELRDLDFEQSADVMYFTHIDHPPQRLTRLAHTSWKFADVAFGPVVLAPTEVIVQPNGSTSDAGYHARSYNYVVTSVDDETGQESRASADVLATNDLTLDGHSNTVSWTAVAGSERYIVYKSETGNSSLYGYIGSTTATTFSDINIQADLADTPPVGSNPFAGSGNNPSTVTFHEQRLMFARTRNKPNGIWGSQSADFENFDVSRPAKADDAISFALVAGRVNAVNQLASLKSLLALTSDALFVVGGGSSDSALTPSTIVSRRQSGRGSSRLGPLIVDNVAFFRPSQGSSVRTIGYQFESDGFETNNVAIFSPHLFDGFDIVAWAYQQEPYACIWCVRSDGVLLCFTWEQEQQVWGWTICPTSGFVQDVCCITENGMDRLYLAVRRTIGGVESLFIERMALPLLRGADLSNACHLDCAVSQEFVDPVAVVGQLWHLEGASVTAFHDGYVTEGLTVQGGKIALPAPARIVTVGLPYEGLIETLPLVLTGAGGTAHVNRQMFNEAVVRVENTRGLSGGPAGGSMFEFKQREGEALGDPIALKTGDFTVKLGAKWSGGATMIVRQTYPLPAKVTAMFFEPSINS